SPESGSCYTRPGRHAYREDRFTQLAVECFVAVEHVLLDELLGNGAAALVDAFRLYVGDRCPENGGEINALIDPERAIFDGDGGVDDRDWHVCQRDTMLRAIVGE